MVIQVGGSSLTLELLDGGESTLPTWLSVRGLELRVAQPTSDREMLTALARRLGARFQRNAAEGVTELRRAFGVGEGRSFEQLAAHHARGDDDIWHHVDGEPGAGLGLLRLGFACNQDCGMCWQGRDWPTAPGDPRKRVDQLWARGARRLSITGGEPTIVRELPSIVQYAAGRGMRVSIQSNAIGLGRPRLLGKLLDAGLEVAFVSLHSANASVSDGMTRAPGTWAKTVQGIRAALEAGLGVRINCVVERANLPGLADHARFVRDELLPHRPDRLMGVAYSHPCRSFDGARFRSQVAPLDAVRPKLVEAAQLLGDAGVPVDLVGSCGFPLCVVQEVVGGLETVDSSPMQDASRQQAEVCRGCAAVLACVGPRREYLEVHGERGLRAMTGPTP